MYARRSRSPAGRRRGVVLILVLAMMGLLAVIGVSFATFSGQARSGAIAYGTRLTKPRPDALIEYAIAQLINDTTNPMSALYGHGLKSDMYGNDAIANGFYDRNPDGLQPTLDVVASGGHDGWDGTTFTNPGAPEIWIVDTTIPTGIGRNFVGWNLRLPSLSPADYPALPVYHVSQTFQVTEQAAVGGFYRFTMHGGRRGTQNLFLSRPDTLASYNIVAPMFFELDGRYRNAFNGTGLAALDGVVAQALTADGIDGNHQAAQFANFRVSGGLLSGAPHLALPYNVHSSVGVDEDYDAPDLENWFLAVQSADGDVVVPSFHRPGILTAQDWARALIPGSPNNAVQRAAVRSASKILRPRGIDHDPAAFPDLVPRADGTIAYDVDNDGDGVADSVWTDLGFPVQRSDDGRLYKPLFSFMVLGLNGRMPLNTAGNLNARVALDNPNTPNFDESGMPLFSHASHLGYSPSEINPLYGLQNAYDPSNNNGTNYPEYDPANGFEKPRHSQFDNAEYQDDANGTYTLRANAVFRHIPVSLSQLRALLTGTRPFNNDGERNQVLVSGGPVNFANNVFDDRELLAHGPTVNRSSSRPVAGRWGEPDAVPRSLSQFTIPGGDVVSPQLSHGLNFSSTRIASQNFIGPNPVRPGRSPFADGQYYFDATDDNFTTYDFRPVRTAASGPELNPNPGGPSDIHDAARRLLLPSERIRRFVTPIDPSGNGRVVRYDTPPDPIAPYGIGPDRFGRVGFFHYFRPPGVPLDTDFGGVVQNNQIVRLIPDQGSLSFPLALNRHNQYRGYESYRNPGSRDLDRNNNGQPDFIGGHFGAMPYNTSNEGPLVGTRRLPRQDASGTEPGRPIPPTDLFAGGGYVGTFTDGINHQLLGKLSGDTNAASYGAGFAEAAANAFPFGSLEWNGPDEMNLYWPEPTDAPFGPSDLEYLYRRQDFDGANLTSRLASLAPISFEAAADAATRRRLFSIETWDRVDATYAHDNASPVGTPYTVGAGNPGFWGFLAPGDPARPLPDQMIRPMLNARFNSTAGAGFDTLNLSTPSIAHRGRKINLNFPLPHSYDPNEPTRQKWITETYQTLKRVLPPHALDTPQELAKLGQFVVNIVDFRDPDNTITIWDNPDVRHLPARRVDGVDYPPSIHLPYRADGTTDPFFQGHLDGGGNTVAAAVQLRHYGMEYQPVAINEVLGFQFNYADPAKPAPSSPTEPPADRNSLANRLYIELVNMLSRPGEGPSTAAVPLEQASHLDLQHWDFVLAKEDPTTAVAAGSPYFAPVFVRPDPVTGQIPEARGVTPPIRPDIDAATAAVSGQAEPVVVASGKKIVDRSVAGAWSTAHQQTLQTATVGSSRRLRGLKASTDPSDDPVDYYVLGGVRLEGDTPADPNTLQGGLPGDPARSYDPNDWDLIPEINDPAFTNTEGLYFWLYLRRPANPLLPPQPIEGAADFNPMVVVDSIRFPFSRSDGRGQTRRTGTGLRDEEATGPTQPIYSIERPQPFRGGQLVPDPDQINQPLFVYGSSEQARPAVNGNGHGRYRSSDPVAVPTDGPPFDSTRRIRESIGSNGGNSVSDLPDGTRESWDYFHFNDRDFMSVAELLLVPGCPPGLFTKQFAEIQPTLPGGMSLNDFQPPATPPPGWTRELVVPRAADPGRSGTPTQDGAFSSLPYTDRTHVPNDPNRFTPGISEPFPHELARTYPYLVHEFFYTSDPAAIADPNNESGRGLSYHIVGGETGAGWHRMMEFFEVPTPVMDAIGPVAQGINFDWFRQDRRPGQLNMNLIFDEEVFFGLLDDPRMLNLLDPVLFMSETISNARTEALPRVVTQVNDAGTPTAFHAMANRGFTLFTNQASGALSTSPTSLDIPWSGMKFAFADFLKQRHGGSGFLFAHGHGPSGTPYDNGGGTFNTRVARDRPYRSLSHYDIFSTLLRPATMETSGPDFLFTAGLAGGTGDNAGRKSLQLDPGYFYSPRPLDPGEPLSGPQSFYPVGFRGAPTARLPVVPPIPPRRLFQVPDAHATGIISASNAAMGDGTNGVPTTYVPVLDANPANIGATTFPMSGGYRGLPTNLFPIDPAVGQDSFLGAVDPTLIPAPAPYPLPQLDTRRQPYFRTELIQKLSNLTTPRTHQYAVWLTVGLFEVTQPGDRARLIPDRLGRELGSGTGSVQRFRSFFILDRSRATGFDPRNPGDYRDVVLYSRRIE